MHDTPSDYWIMLMLTACPQYRRDFVLDSAICGDQFAWDQLKYRFLTRVKC